MDFNWWWLIGILGPLGVTALVRLAIASYRDWRASRSPAAPALSFAATDQVAELEETFRVVFPPLFGLQFNDCFISDESSLEDFAGFYDMSDLHSRIHSLYGVSVSALPNDRLVTIVGEIARRRRGPRSQCT